MISPFYFIKWEHFERFLKTIQVISIVTAVVGSYFGFLQIQQQIAQLNQTRSGQSADLVLRMEEKLGKDSNRGIFNAIDQNQPILEGNGGNYTSEQLNDYLGVFNELNDFYEAEVLTDMMIYNNFYDYLIKTYNNEEIKQYIKDIRTIDKTYFLGFDYLVEALKKLED